MIKRLTPSLFRGKSFFTTNAIKEGTEAHSPFRGKVFVFSGILPVAGNDDGLATILGHEIAHNVLHHAGENISRSMVIVAPLVWLLTFAFDVTYTLPAILVTYAYDLPGSRKQEVRLFLL